MKFPLFFRKSLAAKLVAAFVLTAVPPMLAASHVASSMVSESANQGIVNWLHETANYLFTTIRDTETEMIAVQTLLRPRLARDETAFSAEEAEALANLDIDVIALKDDQGRVLFSNAPSWSVEEAPLYPGSRFHWLAGPDGAKALAVAAVMFPREAVRTARHERSRMLGEIALGFAHEIRNPLLVIKTSAELVHKSLPSGGKETRLMGFIIEEVGRIDSLFTEFLSFAKPMPLKPDYFQLDALVRKVLELSAAEMLCISERSIWHRIKKLGIAVLNKREVS